MSPYTRSVHGSSWCSSCGALRLYCMKQTEIILKGKRALTLNLIVYGSLDASFSSTSSADKCRHLLSYFGISPRWSASLRSMSKRRWEQKHLYADPFWIKIILLWYTFFISSDTTSIYTSCNIYSDHCFIYVAEHTWIVYVPQKCNKIYLIFTIRNL